MRSILLLPVFFSTLLLHAQGFNVLGLPDNSGSSRGASVREVPGGYLVFGERNDADTVYRVHVSMYDPFGALLWERAVVDAAPTVIAYADAVSPTLADGGWLASVTLQEEGAMTWRAYRFGADGDTLWTKDLSTAFQVFPRASVQQSGAYFYSAFTQASTFSSTVGTVVKLDTSGDVLHTATFPYMEFDMLTLAGGLENDLIIAAGRSVTQSPYRSVVARLDTALNVVWSRNIIVGFPGLSSYSSRVAKVAHDTDGNVLVAGNCNGQWGPSGPAPVEFYITKLSRSDGSLMWIKRHAISVSENGLLNDMEVLPDGDVVSCGIVTPEVDGEYRGFIQRYSPEGDERWRRYFRFLSEPEAVHDIRDVTPTDDGGFVLTGNAQASPGSPTALWLLRVDEHGCVEPGCQTIGVEEVMIGLPESVLRCAPMPAYDQFTVSIELPVSIQLRGELRLLVTDVAGKLVHDVLLADMHAQQLRIDVGAWGRGTYVLHLLHGGLSLVGRKVVVQ